MHAVGLVEQDGNINIDGVQDRGETDAVRGISVDWFIEGQGYCERDLKPMEYRILCVLLLIPLAVLGPQSRTRREQLYRHWCAFKLASGTCSDTDAQHLLLGILIRAQQNSAIEGLAMARCDFRDLAARSSAEGSFRNALRTALSPNERVKPGDVIAEVQARIKALEEQR